MNNVLSISGGKDSTAMLLEMLGRGEPVHSAIFFDTGWEFPAMYEHIEKLERYTGVKIWRLHPILPFDYWLTARPIVARKGQLKGQVSWIGNGWPRSNKRWCTSRKVDAIDMYCRPIPKVVQCVGYAADETNRSLSSTKFSYRFPLKEYNITESAALQICYRHGFDWGGLYDIFHRVSCFCCPLQRLGELKKVRKYFPDLWARMLDLDSAIPNNHGFKGEATVAYLESRFAADDKQIKLFGT